MGRRLMLLRGSLALLAMVFGLVHCQGSDAVPAFVVLVPVDVPSEHVSRAEPDSRRFHAEYTFVASSGFWSPHLDELVYAAIHAVDLKTGIRSTPRHLSSSVLPNDPARKTFLVEAAGASDGVYGFVASTSSAVRMNGLGGESTDNVRAEEVFPDVRIRVVGDVSLLAIGEARYVDGILGELALEDLGGEVSGQSVVACIGDGRFEDENPTWATPPVSVAVDVARDSENSVVADLRPFSETFGIGTVVAIYPKAASVAGDPCLGKTSIHVYGVRAGAPGLSRRRVFFGSEWNEVRALGR